MDVGIVCKVWNIKGSSKSKGTVNQLRDSLDYILNDEKTSYISDLDPVEQLKRECKYIENDVKTFSGAYVGGYNVSSTNVKSAVSEMMDIKRLYGKEDGRAALHMIISLPEDESSLNNAENLMKLCNAIVKELFPNNQAVFAIHTNTDNLHAHIIVNSVGLDGKKIHQPKDYMKKVVHPCINKYAASFGFTQNPKWKMTDDKSAFPKIKMSLRKAIDQAIEHSSSYEDFVSFLEKNNIKVNTGKHISLLPLGMNKAIRTHRLGNNYTRDAIIERIMLKKEQFVLPDVNNKIKTVNNSKVFDPVIFKLSKYKDLPEKEKKRVIKLLRLGKNPWRENVRMNWQLNKIADDLNLAERVSLLVDSYSQDGSIKSALDSILEAKKSVAYEKKLIAFAKRKYKPILDIYSEMKQLEKKAYLYEHKGVALYRPEFEKYRKLTRRLKNNYGKEVFEVASFLNECDERLLYSSEQLKELSLEYRELFNYGKKHGILHSPQQSIFDLIEYYDDFKNIKSGYLSTDGFFLSSNTSDIVIQAIKYPVMDDKGHFVEKYDIKVFDKSGNEIRSFSNTDANTDFKDRLSSLQKEFNLTSMKRFDNYSLAREYCMSHAEAINNVNMNRKDDSFASDTDIYFSQAVNHSNIDYSPVIISTDHPSYYALPLIIADGQLEISILSSNLDVIEKFQLPVISHKSNSGYKILSHIMNKYGFDGPVKEFKSLDDAKKYSSSIEKERTRIK